MAATASVGHARRLVGWSKVHALAARPTGYGEMNGNAASIFVCDSSVKKAASSWVTGVEEAGTLFGRGLAGVAGAGIFGVFLPGARGAGPTGLHAGNAKFCRWLGAGLLHIDEFWP